MTETQFLHRMTETLTVYDGFLDDALTEDGPLPAASDHRKNAESFRVALRRSPNDTDLLNKLGISLVDFARTESGESALHALEEAQRRFRRASDEARRQGAPPATCLRFDINRAFVLWMIGEQSHDPVTIIDAVDEILQPIVNQFASESADNPDIQEELARALDILGSAHMALDKKDEAIRAYEAAIDKANAPRAIARSLSNLGTAFVETERYAEACDRFKEALSILRRRQEPLSWARIQYRLGDALFKQAQSRTGQAKEARPYYAQAVKAFEAAELVYRSSRTRPEWASVTVNLANARVGFGACLFSLGDAREQQSGIEEVSKGIWMLVEAIPDLPPEWRAEGQTYHDRGLQVLELISGSSKRDPFLYLRGLGFATQTRTPPDPLIPRRTVSDHPMTAANTQSAATAGSTEASGLSPQAQALFSDLPASLQRAKPHTKRNWSEQVLRDASVMTEAQRIVNAFNYRKRKGLEATGAEHQQYRVAKSLLSARSRRQKAMPPE